MGANVCPKYGGRVQGPGAIPTPIRVMESETHTDTGSIRSPSHSYVPFILHGTRLAYSALPLQTRLVSQQSLHQPIVILHLPRHPYLDEL